MHTKTVGIFWFRNIARKYNWELENYPLNYIPLLAISCWQGKLDTERKHVLVP